MENQWIQDWISSVCESEGTVRNYSSSISAFDEFSKLHGRDLSRIVVDWRAAKRLGENDREAFIDEWTDLVKAHHTRLKKKIPALAPGTIKNRLANIKSFFRFWQIPVRVDLPKRACVVFHNRDLSREEVKKILSFSSPRDRAILLVLTESGMRIDTCVNLRFWQIKQDFLAERVPMRILLPSNVLKDHPGDRWTFIGEDGFRELQRYLSGKALQDQDYVFSSEKRGLVLHAKREQFSPSSLSVKFSRLVLQLGIDARNNGKPKQIRLHGLRKFWFNNLMCDSLYKQFWMGHAIGIDAHYFNVDVERHREEYRKGYASLRVYEPHPGLEEIQESLQKRDLKLQEQDKAIRDLKARNQQLYERVEELRKDSDYFKQILEVLREPNNLSQFEKWIQKGKRVQTSANENIP